MENKVLQNFFFIEHIRLVNKIGKKISQRAKDAAVSFSQQSPFYPIKEKLIFTQWTYPIPQPTSTTICSKNFSKSNKRAFRCCECMQIDTALLCYDCFAKGNHKGHIFRQFETQEGYCDCGNSQVWSQNGFCPAHSNKDNKVNIPQKIKQLFIKELTFVYYIYLWTVENSSQYPRLQKIYGEALFLYMNKMAQLNFQTKTLIVQLMSSSFGQQYPPLSTMKNTIISSILSLDSKFKEIQNFQKLVFHLYEIQSFKEFILMQYFKATSNNMGAYYILRNANYQYLTCNNAINKLISQKKLLPLHINPNIYYMGQNSIKSMFKQYYQDLNYLHKAKGNKQYYISHFSKTHAVDMACYRKNSSLQSSSKLYLDQFYLKVLGAGISLILDYPQLILKNIKELLYFIVGFKDVTYSLAQQRAYAMHMMAYLNGSLQKLLIPQVRDSVALTLGSPHILKRLIVKGLKNIAIAATDPVEEQVSEYQKYFYSVFPEKCFQLQLDLVYHKILMLLSIDELEYWEVVQQTIQELSGLLKGQQFITQLSLFLCKLFTQQLNEITVCNNIGIVHRQKIVQFYRRVIATYGDRFQVKQIKMLACFFINNAQLFDEVLRTQTKYTRQKINLTHPIDPIDKLSYPDMLKKFKFYDQLPWNSSTVTQLKHLKSFDLFNQKFIEIVINNAINLMKRIQKCYKTSIKGLQAILQRQIIAILQIFFLKNSKEIKSFLKEYTQQLKNHLSISLIDFIINLCKQKQQIEGELKQQEQDKQEEYKKKRQKIQAKRKEKALLMKKNQQQLLQQYNFKEQPSQIQACIFCKEDLANNSFLMSYIGLTNLISQRMLGQKNIHLFFTTCGHKIHDYCYSKSAGSRHQSRCFLCKKRTNILIPQASQVSPQNRINFITTFLDTIYAILCQQNQQQNHSLMYQFYEVQNKGNILNAILTSIVRECIYYGLHNFESFKKYSLPAYYRIFQLVRMASRWQLHISLCSIKRKQDSDRNPFTIFQNYAIKLLRRELLKKQNTIQSLNQSLVQNVIQDNFQSNVQTTLEFQISKNVDKIIYLLSNHEEKQVLINCYLINRSELFKTVLPTCITKLHQLIVECPFCHKLTNWIYYCLLCGWKACSKQDRRFHKHAKQDHIEGCVFICVSNGRYSIFHNGHVKSIDSLYENSYGEPYLHTEQNSKKSNMLQFKLNEAKFDKLYLDILSHSLHNFVKQ